MKKFTLTLLSVLSTLTTVFSQTATWCLEKAKESDFVFEGKVIGYEIEEIENTNNWYIRSKVKITKIYKGHEKLSFSTIEVISGPDIKRWSPVPDTFYATDGEDNYMARGIFMCKLNDEPVAPPVNFTAEIPLRMLETCFYHLTSIYNRYYEHEIQFINKLKELPGIEEVTEPVSSLKSTEPSDTIPEREYIDGIPADIYEKIKEKLNLIEKLN